MDPWFGRWQAYHRPCEQHKLQRPGLWPPPQLLAGVEESQSWPASWEACQPGDCHRRLQALGPHLSKFCVYVCPPTIQASNQSCWCKSLLWQPEPAASESPSSLRGCKLLIHIFFNVAPGCHLHPFRHCLSDGWILITWFFNSQSFQNLKRGLQLPLAYRNACVIIDAVDDVSPCKGLLARSRRTGEVLWQQGWLCWEVCD